MLVDHHCHLDFPQFADDLPGVLARAEAAGVGIMVSISTRIRKFAQLSALVAPHPQLYCSLGTHPHNAHEELDIPVADIVALSADAKCVAIGEAGLDYYYDKSPRKAQEEGFRNHIEAARQTGLPLVIHARDADADTARILEEEMRAGPFTAVLHCFTGGRELAERGVAIGLYVSFSGVITFKTSTALREIAAALPLDRILVETDAPYLAPVPKRGRPNEPAYVAYTAHCLADVRSMAFDELAAATTANFHRLYTKVPRRIGPITQNEGAQ